MASPAQALLVEVGEAVLRLEPGPSYGFGRGSDNAVRLRHGSVSQQHCTVAWDGDAWVVDDLDSTNGTWIEGVRVQHARLAGRNTLRLGSVEVVVRAGEATSPTPVPTPVPPARQRHDGTFAEAMADELRRAPWLALSLVLHAALLLMLMWLVGEEPLPRRDVRALTWAQGEEPADLVQQESPDEQVAIEPMEESIDLSDPTPSEAFPNRASPATESFDDPIEPGSRDLGEHGWMAKVRGAGGGILAQAAIGGGGFRETVAQIRQTGLEIVFVFDSTGSMGRVLDATKRNLAGMVQTLHALVPDAKVGIVTYRDHGHEDYLTRQAPLGDDLYRALNFMQSVDAGGGGDRPEAVLEGLSTAFGQPWSQQARRCVVLVGDAPPHDVGAVERAVRAFRHNGSSAVHAIVTSPGGRSNLPDDTLQAFRAIASAGGGECVPFDDEARVLQQVLTLAFGKQYRDNLAEATREVQGRGSRMLQLARDLVQRADLRAIERHLRRVPVHGEVVQALSESHDPRIADRLVDLLARPDFPPSGRQAAAYALQRLAGLGEPPIDVDAAGPISSRTADALRAVIHHRLR